MYLYRGLFLGPTYGKKTYFRGRIAASRGIGVSRNTVILILVPVLTNMIYNQ